MNFKFEKEQTRSTPYILIDEEKNYMKFKGKSFSEQVVEFYREVSRWLDCYLTTDFKAFTFDCELEYFNSSTTRFLINMLRDMDKAAGNGKEIIVNWVVDEDNEIITECVQDFQDELNNFEIKMVLV